MSAAFTPGPWEFFPSVSKERPFVIDTKIGVESTNDLIIAEVQRGKQGEANARLIAAAPDLYGRLTEAREAIATLPEDAFGEVNLPDGWTGAAMVYSIRDELLCKLDAALAKARGEQ